MTQWLGVPSACSGGSSSSSFHSVHSVNVNVDVSNHLVNQNNEIKKNLWRVPIVVHCLGPRALLMAFHRYCGSRRVFSIVDRCRVYMHSTRTDSERTIPSPSKVVMACSKSHEQHLPNSRPNPALSFVRVPEKLQVAATGRWCRWCCDWSLSKMVKGIWCQVEDKRTEGCPWIAGKSGVWAKERLWERDNVEDLQEGKIVIFLFRKEDKNKGE